MKVNIGCDFCNDLRNIEPAKYIGFNNPDDEIIDFFEFAREHKKFIWHFMEEDGSNWFGIVEECPNCGLKFTKEMYDDYD